MIRRRTFLGGLIVFLIGPPRKRRDRGLSDRYGYGYTGGY